MCPAAQGDADPPCLPLRGRWQREGLAGGEIPHGSPSPSRLRRQPPPRGGLPARHCRADGTRGRRPLRSLYGKPACPFVGGDAHIAPPREIAFRRRDTRVPPYRVRRSCGADRVVRRDRISAGTRAVEHQGTHRGRGQRRATAHRGKLWRHNPLNRKKPENRLRVGQVSAKS